SFTASLRGGPSPRRKMGFSAVVVQQESPRAVNYKGAFVAAIGAEAIVKTEGGAAGRRPARARRPGALMSRISHAPRGMSAVYRAPSPWPPTPLRDTIRTAGVPVTHDDRAAAEEFRRGATAAIEALAEGLEGAAREYSLYAA